MQVEVQVFQLSVAALWYKSEMCSLSGPCWQSGYASLYAHVACIHAATRPFWRLRVGANHDGIPLLAQYMMGSRFWPTS